MLFEATNLATFAAISSLTGHHLKIDSPVILICILFLIFIPSIIQTWLWLMQNLKQIQYRHYLGFGRLTKKGQVVSEYFNAN